MRFATGFSGILMIVIASLILATTGFKNDKAQDPDGKPLYKKHCQSCHGATGVPSKRMADMYPKIPTFDAKFFGTRSDDSLVAVMDRGVGKDMKPYKGKITRQEMQAIAIYMRTFGKKKP